MKSTATPLSVRFQVSVIGLLRPDLSREYGSDMTATLTELHIEARRNGWAMWRLWWREFRSLLSTVLGRKSLPMGPRHTKQGRRSRHPKHRANGLTLIQDFRYAVRSMTRAPGLVAITVLSLGVGIGGATTVFSLVNAMLLRPRAGVESSERLVTIYTSDFSGPLYGGSSFPDFVDFRASVVGLEDAAAMDFLQLNLRTAEGGITPVMGQRVTGNYLDVLGVQPILGRRLIAGDDTEQENHGTVLLGYGLWQRHFGGASDVLGSSLTLGAESYTVVGVLPEGFRLWELPLQVDVLIPIDSRRWQERSTRGVGIVGRLAAGATVQSAQAQLDVVADRLYAEYPREWRNVRDERRTITMISEAESRLPPDGRGVVVITTSVLMGVMGLVLLVACSNVVNLLLNRGATRRTEIAVRVAMGATKKRLVSLLLAEGLLLAGMAGLLGIAIGYITTGIFSGVNSPLPNPGVMEVVIDARVTAFAFIVTAATGLLLGLAPALQASRPDIMTSIRGLSESARMGRLSLRNALVVAQVAGSTVLLVGSTMFLRSIQAASDLDLGFEPTDVATVRINIADAGYDSQTGLQFYDELLGQIEAIGGVERAALAARLPLSPSRSRRGVSPEGYTRARGEDMEVYNNIVSSGYFDVIKMDMLRGRAFDERDRTGGQRVAMVNEAFVARFWPGQEAVGKHVTLAGEEAEVVGLVRNAYQKDLTSAVPFIWTPLAQDYRSRVDIAVRGTDATSLLATIRQQITALDATVPILRQRPFESAIADATAPQRVASAVLGAAGIGALLLAMMGVYGVLAYAVSRRTREVGIRVALGARSGEVVTMIIAQGLKITAVGVGVGVLLAVPAAMVARSVLYGVQPFDLVALGGGALLLSLASIGASAIPARRAANVDPMVALRFE